MSRSIMSDKIKQHKEVLAKSELKRESIKNCLEQDKCSRMCPGKKDTKTKSNVKKHTLNVKKRVLNDTMKRIYLSNLKENPKIPYYEPVYIL